MVYSIRNVFPNILPRLYHLAREGFSNYRVSTISLVAFAAIGLYKYFISSSSPKPRNPILDPATAKIIENYTNRNRKNIQDKFYILKILFYGPSGDEQAMIAEKMARDLGLKFHYFDGRKMGDKEYLKKSGWSFEFNRIEDADTPEFVFISHADEVCRHRDITDHSPEGKSISTLLSHTGTQSETLLFCVGVSSLDHIDPGLDSRYSQMVYIPLPGLKERFEILKTYLPKLFTGTTAAKPSQEQLAKIAEKAGGLSRQSLEQVLEDLHNQKTYASKWTEEMVDLAICNKMERQRVPLPNLAERTRLLKESGVRLEKILTPEKLHSIAEKTDGFSQHMMWSMLLDMHNQSLTDDWRKRIPLTESIVDQVVTDWIRRSKEDCPDLNKRMEIMQKYAKKWKLELFTPEKIQSIAEDIEGLSEEYIFRMMQDCGPWSKLTEKELDQRIERWKPRSKRMPTK